MKNKSAPYILTFLGIILLAAGLVILKAYNTAGGLLQTAAYFGVGIGCGVFGHGAGELLSRRAMKSNPEAARAMEIEQNDERNIAIRNAAQARAYSLMVTVFGALLVAFSLMGVDLVVILMLVAAYLFVCGSSIYYRIKLEKEM